MNKSALLLLAEGAEDIESVTVIDVLRRGQIRVTVGGVSGSEPVKCSNGTIICPDQSLDQAKNLGPYDAIILPGGLIGSKKLSESVEVGKLLSAQSNSDRVIAAICAAPTALKAHNIGKGKRVTSYPAMKNDLKDLYQYIDDSPVVVDGKLITSRGPATALIFALTILEQLQGIEVAKDVASKMLYDY